jgi:hypothetical protein
LTGCSSNQPDQKHELPDPGQYQPLTRQPVSLDAGAATQTFTATPRTARTQPSLLGYVSFQQYRRPDHCYQRVSVRRHLGFADRAANLHSGPGWNGPGDRQVARGEQSPDNRVRASAHRQDRNQPGHGADPRRADLAFPKVRASTTRPTPSAAGWTSPAP